MSTSPTLCLSAPPPLPNTTLSRHNLAPPRPPPPVVLCVSALSCRTSQHGAGATLLSPSSSASSPSPFCCCYVSIPSSSSSSSSSGTFAGRESIRPNCCGHHHHCSGLFRDRPRAQLTTTLSSSQLKSFALMACCFCCCPVFRSLLWFCAFELILSLYLWYGLLNDLIRTFHTNTELKDVLLLLVLTCWLVTLGVSTGSLLWAHRKKDPQFVLPRLIQQTGLLVLGFLLAFLLVIYFAGGAHTINSWLIVIYENWFSDPLSREAHQDAHESLRFYFLALILLDFLLICYISCALCATKKYYRELKADVRGTFQRVSQYEPNPTVVSRQPPMNPHFKG